jgi:hypothetical protein
MEDSWLATGAPARVVIKFGRLEYIKFGPFCQIASVKISENSITRGKIKGTKLLMN